MRTAQRLLPAIVVIGIVLSPWAPTQSIATARSNRTLSDDARLVDWARSRFATAGLELPTITVEFHGDFEGCGGNAGLYTPGQPARVDICGQTDMTSTAARLIVLHELAHAWAETTLDDEAKERFLGMRHLDAWIDPAEPAHLWGAEHVAEVVSWGLMDEPVTIVRIDDARPDRLAQGFRAVTGTEPLIPAGEPVVDTADLDARMALIESDGPPLGVPAYAVGG